MKPDNQEEVRNENVSPQAVHIISPMPRCGTTLLAFVLVESGCCSWPSQERILAEDFFLKHAHLIRDYCDKTSEEWGHFTQDRNLLDRLRDLLLVEIGQGLLRFADHHSSGAPIVLKTPHADNIDLLPRLFPNSKALFLMRDGRDAVESADRAFPRASFEYWVSRWAIGVRDILQFINRNEKDSATLNWKLIRYEKLISEETSVIQELLDFFGNTRKYTWRDLQALPVYGSSFRNGKENKFKWEIQSKPENFNPLCRWALWSDDRKQKFKDIAGAELIQLGYVLDDRW